LTDKLQTQLERWHKFVATKDFDILDELLADDVKFHSPFVWKPKEGKATAVGYLSAATTVFVDFAYQREFIAEHDWALEFTARVGELTVKGIDLIRFNDAGEIEDFEVMVRPANALQALGAEMRRRLAERGVL
jgi:hypothetical protein